MENEDVELQIADTAGEVWLYMTCAKPGLQYLESPFILHCQET